MIKLRDYQEYSVNKFFEHVNNGFKNICIALYTGTGKTFVSAAIAEKYINNNKPVIFIADKVNIVNQTVDSFEHLGDVQIIQGKKKFTQDGLIYIASLQTLIRRDIKIKPGLIVHDEKHSGHKGQSHKKIMKQFPGVDYLSLTATPFDADGIPLKGFDKIIKYKNIRYFIDKEYLTDCICYAPVLPDLSKVRKTKEDYNEQDLDHVMNNSSMIGEIINKTKEKIKNKKCLFFAVNISHAENTANKYRKEGFIVELYHSKLKDKIREQILDDFKNNKINILVSVTALIAGFDDPSVDCLIIGRPIRSISFLRQLYGRGMRPFKDKKICLILDCAGVIKNDNLPSQEVMPRKKNDKKQIMNCEVCNTKAKKFTTSIRNVNSILNYVTTWRCSNGHYFESLREVNKQVCKKCSKVLEDSEFRENNEKYEVFIKCECGEETTIRTIPKNNNKLQRVQHAGIVKIKYENLIQKLESESDNIIKLKDHIIKKIHPDMQYNCLLSLYNNRELELDNIKKKLIMSIVYSSLETNRFECLNSKMLKLAYNITKDPVNIVNMHNSRSNKPMAKGWTARTIKIIKELKNVYHEDILLDKTKEKCQDITRRNQKMASLFYYFEGLSAGGK